MANPGNNMSLWERLLPAGFYEIIIQERVFLALIGVFFFIAAVVSPYPHIAMWVGFLFAGYSTIANDSIQTIGTFLASNAERKWWILWLYIGGIFLVTVTVSFIIYDGDVSYQRLTSKGFEEAPTSFSFLHIAAPIFLLIITRMRMPVSTTFLLLSAFSASAEGITSVLGKSLQGYFLAFVAGLIVWIIVTKTVERRFNGKAHHIWIPLQWIISGVLWSVWIMQDAANIAIYLPRLLNLQQFLFFSVSIFLGLGVLFYLRGDRIQKIVTDKSRVSDVRSATIIDFVYSALLVYKLTISTIPMSTTWVFLGLLAGREVGISFMDKAMGKPMRKVLRMISKDLMYALIGLAISMILAIAINPSVGRELLELIGY